MRQKPLVSIIIVNYNGRHLLGDCLGALERLTYPKKSTQIIVVDNNSADDSVQYVQKNFPTVTVVRSKENLGFTGGNILGYEQATGEYIVLLNSDTVVEPGWLSACVKAAEENPQVGAVNAKLYYWMPFLSLSIRSDVVFRSRTKGSSDLSPLGVLIEDILCKETPCNDEIWYGDGFYDPDSSELPLRWTNGNAEVFLPFSPDKSKQTYVLTVHGHPYEGAGAVPMQVTVGGTEIVQDVLQPFEVKQYTITIDRTDAERSYVWHIQNAGNVVLGNGLSKDRGNLSYRTPQAAREFYEIDSTYYQQQASLLAFCGASCLLRRTALEQVGFLDDQYYMYYEDLDLSLRLWLHGWDILYEPNAVVYHKHSATTKKSGASFQQYYVDKNHLAFVTTYFPYSVIFSEIMVFAIQCVITYVRMMSYTFRDNLPQYALWMERYRAKKRAGWYYLRHIPSLLRKRYAIRATQTRSIAEMQRYLY